MNVTLSQKELGAVLAGLRLLHLHLDSRFGPPNSHDLSEILTDGGAHAALTPMEIGDLCESLNTCADAFPVAVVQMNGGAIYCARAIVPMRIILLDEDVEGGDRERIMGINGNEVYVHDFALATRSSEGQSGLDPNFVGGVISQVDADTKVQAALGI